MQNITSVAGLKNAIQVLEVDQSVKGRLLKEQVYLIYESLKPINILRNSLKELFPSHHLIENMSGTAIGAAGGFLLKKVFVGASANMFRKLIGTVLQFGITNIITKNSDQIKSFAQTIFQHLFSKKEMSTRKSVGQRDID
jgi:hypothetical protein